MTIGIAIGLITGPDVMAHAEASVDSVLESTPSGRIAAYVWEVPPLGITQSPIEAYLTRRMLGDPTDRTEDKRSDPWLLYGTLVIRHYDTTKSGLPLVALSQSLLFRRQGEPAYKRVRDDSNPPLADEMHTLHPAFTRDVANNTWHLPSDHGMARVAARITRLMSWSDEELAVFLDGIPSSVDIRNFDLSTDLIGVPNRSDYAWAIDHQIGATLALDLQ